MIVAEAVTAATVTILYDPTFWLLVGVGFCAQLLDGSVGMGYGIIGSTFLLSIGLPPAQVSAMMHSAKVFTSSTSGASHLLLGNVDAKLFWRLMPMGVLGGFIGATVLINVPGDIIKPFILLYLAVMGLYILHKALFGTQQIPPHHNWALPLGFTGGFLDAMGGGGWGPVTATTLMGTGHRPRYVVGSVNASEFFVTTAVVGALLTAIIQGELSVSFADYAKYVGGLIAGGLIAAPVAASFARFAPPRVMLFVVGLLVAAMSIWQGFALFF